MKRLVESSPCESSVSCPYKTIVYSVLPQETSSGEEEVEEEDMGCGTESGEEEIEEELGVTQDSLEVPRNTRTTSGANLRADDVIVLEFARPQRKRTQRCYPLFFFFFFSFILSHFYVGSMYDNIRLHVARIYTSSADSPFSLTSSFTLSKHLLLGLPLFLLPCTFISITLLPYLQN